jgi:hypothetical protein
MARVGGRLAAHVLFIKPGELQDGWENTDTWKSAQRISGVMVRRDDAGLEAQLFGAATSGQVVLYDGAGRLLFSGGITPSRGHVGESAGVTRIIDLITKGEADQPDSLVFGCPIEERSEMASTTGTR